MAISLVPLALHHVIDIHQQNPFMRLSDDTEAHVYSFLDAKSLCVVAGVSKKNREVSSKDVIWKPLFACNLPHDYQKIEGRSWKKHYLIEKGSYFKVPDEIHTHIYTFLNAYELCQLAGVSYKHNVLSSTNEIWEELFDEDRPHFFAKKAQSSWKHHYLRNDPLEDSAEIRLEKHCLENNLSKINMIFSMVSMLFLIVEASLPCDLIEKNLCAVPHNVTVLINSTIPLNSSTIEYSSAPANTFQTLMIINVCYVALAEFVNWGSLYFYSSKRDKECRFFHKYIRVCSCVAILTESLYCTASKLLPISGSIVTATAGIMFAGTIMPQCPIKDRQDRRLSMCQRIHHYFRSLFRS